MEPRLVKTIASYDRVAKKYNERNRTYKFWLAEFREFQKLIPGRRVLEIGCGAGRDATLFLRNKYSYLGIDASRGLLSIARRTHPGARFRKMDLFAMTFPAHSFDGCWSIATLLHVPKRRLPTVLKDIYRIVKPGGVFVVSVKKKRSADELIIREEKYGGVERFFSFYGIAEFRTFLVRSGFHVQKQFTHHEDTNIWISFVAIKPKN